MTTVPPWFAALLGLVASGVYALAAGGEPEGPGKAWLVRAAAIAAGLTLLFVVVRLRTRALEKRARLLDAEVGRRTAELEASNRELLEAKKSLAELARRDPLTGLYNRRAADERLEELCAERQRHPGALAVLLFDLDDFKPVNDTYGHEAGDVVLKAVAAECARSIRGGDFLARWGGDEFLLVYPQASPESAARAADRLRRVIERTKVRVRPDLTVNVTMSGGIAALTPHHGATPGELIAMADAALYTSKHLGRNRVSPGSPDGAVGPVRFAAT